eukprot:TRINITY_DN3740_c0_g2_i1.p2 TRINITY_DN3740_c0_g2~~TRINITY_DN3740_c0_g2_i1.p2  ORF type:complete len:244 (+),score=56.91 TRINITY_DN3740_c0_g2_i1:91-822(+)
MMAMSILCLVLAVAAARELKQGSATFIDLIRDADLINPSGSIQFAVSPENTTQGFGTNSGRFFTDGAIIFATNPNTPQVDENTTAVGYVSQINGFVTVPGAVTAVTGNSSLLVAKGNGDGSATITEGGVRSAAQGNAPGGSGIGFNVIANQATLGNADQQIFTQSFAQSQTADEDSFGRSAVAAFGGSESSGNAPRTGTRSSIFSGSTDNSSTLDCSFVSQSAGTNGLSSSNCVGSLSAGVNP